MRPTDLDSSAPVRVSLSVALEGVRYGEDRATTTVVSGDKVGETDFTERWTLALQDAAEAPWRLVSIGHSADGTGRSAAAQGARMKGS